MKKSIFLTLVVLFSFKSTAQTAQDSTEKFQLHFQTTVITMHKPGVKAAYTFAGYNSLSDTSETATSLTATMCLGAKLWQGAELYVNPEVAGGAGVSRATGAAGFPNGETFRVGNPTPTVYFARYFLRQTFDLSPKMAQNGSNTEGVLEHHETGFNQLAGFSPKHSLVLTLGKFCLADIFDGNTYSHDPRTRFMNWSLMSNGAWDYPADVRGYTYSLTAEYRKNDFAARLSTALVPKEANGANLDWAWSKANGTTLELEKGYRLGSQSGVIRGLLFYNIAQMGNYQTAVQSRQGVPDIEDSRIYSRTKYGFGVNIEHTINENIGLFAKTSWNDGKNETWAFTEIDNSASLGCVWSGVLRGRPKDVFGLAFVTNGISAEHQEYLRLGGKGFIIGDGNLNYGRETIFETFYNLKVGQNFWFSPDVQLLINPAYNRDRGPAVTFAIRANVEI